MKGLSTLIAFAGIAKAHSIFQKVSVNGVDQGQLKGVRAPRSNNPIENVNHADFACNTNLQYKDNTIITVPAGARVGAWWGHEIGGASGTFDPDHPIAASHKGPVIVYLAKVDNAATIGTTGLKWFKVAEDGLSGTTWAVDTLIANDGWHYFTMPSCIAPGDYLMRVEIIALHNAYTYPGAQFYMECAQIRITGSGSTVGSETVSFPGAYQSNHPGITISIYDQTGRPLNGGRPYQIPGPKVLTCPSNGGGNPGNPSNPPATTMTTSVIPAPTQAPGGAPLWSQCGGQGWTGPTTCASGTCKETNQWYSQCQP